MHAKTASHIRQPFWHEKNARLRYLWRGLYYRHEVSSIVIVIHVFFNHAVCFLVFTNEANDIGDVRDTATGFETRRARQSQFWYKKQATRPTYMRQRHTSTPDPSKVKTHFLVCSVIIDKVCAHVLYSNQNCSSDFIMQYANSNTLVTPRCWPTKARNWLLGSLLVIILLCNCSS